MSSARVSALDRKVWSASQQSWSRRPVTTTLALGETRCDALG
jgi:hypothetical protein